MNDQHPAARPADPTHAVSRTARSRLRSLASED